MSHLSSQRPPPARGRKHVLPKQSLRFKKLFYQCQRHADHRAEERFDLAAGFLRGNKRAHFTLHAQRETHWRGKKEKKNTPRDTLSVREDVKHTSIRTVARCDRHARLPTSQNCSLCARLIEIPRAIKSSLAVSARSFRKHCVQSRHKGVGCC